MRVSTIIPVFNGSATLAAAIDSAISQGLDGQEIIVINDGSTDATSSVATSYGSKVRLIEQSRRGPSAARNAGAAMASGEYLAFLDADDIWLEERITKTCAALDRNSKAVLAFSDLIPMNQRGESGEPWVIGQPPSMSDLLTRGCRVYPSAVTMRRGVYELCRGFDETLPKLADHYLWLLAREHGEFAYVPEPLAIYRTTDFELLADKYLPGFSPFARAVQQRYGKRARPLVFYFRMVFTSSLVGHAAVQLNHGLRLAACFSLGRALALSPSALLKLLRRRHMPAARNVWRMLALGNVASKQKAVPPVTPR
jgi:glycosyltransferase involved in cell wall biosynthesis